MPENVGGIEYTVGADTAPLLKSERDVERSTKKIERGFDQADRAVEGFNAEMKRLPSAVQSANRAIVQTDRNLKSMNGTVGQVGFQLQDIAVQLQGGTSPFVVLGQQGSQIAGAFGPGGAVLGAIIAVGSALAGVFAAGAASASDAVEELTVDVDELIDSIGALTEAQKAYLELTLSGRINDLQGQISVLRNEAESLRATLSSPIRDDDFLKETSDRLAEVNALIDGLTGQVDRYRNAIKGARDDNENWNDSNAESSTRLETLVASTQASAAAITEENGALQRSARAKALYIANTLGATSAQIADINAAFDRIEAYEAEQKALAELQKQQRAEAAAGRQQERQDIGVIEDLQRQLMTEEQLINESYQRRREAILNQTMEGSAERHALLMQADQARLMQLEELAIKAGDTAEALEASFENALTNVGDNFANTFADAIVEGESLSQSLRGVAQAFLKDILSALIKVGARMAINAALGNAAQTTAAATGAATGAALAASYAPAAALASLASFGANAAPAQAGLASTLALSQSLSAVPGLQLGGPIGAGQLRRVNENGPEMFTDGARQFLLPDRSGRVVSNSDASAGGGSAPVNINFNVTNTSQGANFEVESVNQNQTEITINAIVTDIQSGNGPVSRALYNSTNVTSRANG